MVAAPNRFFCCEPLHGVPAGIRYHFAPRNSVRTSAAAARCRAAGTWRPTRPGAVFARALDLRVALSEWRTLLWCRARAGFAGQAVAAKRLRSWLCVREA